MKSHRLSSIVACSAALLNAVATRSAHAHAGHGHGSSAADAVLHWFADMSHLSAIGLMFAGVAMVVFTLRIVWRRANEYVGLRIFAAVGMCVWCTGAHAQRIAAASDVQPVLDELLRTYTNPQGTKMTVTYASSGKLAMQIEAGARFAFYVSADAFWVDRLRTRNPSALVSPLASGRLMLVAPIGSNMCADGLPGTRTFAKRFAIAHPEHAPYGNRAREVLQRQGSWDTLLMGKRIVMADSVASAAQWIVTGAAEAGLVSWTHHAQFPKSKFCVLKVPSAQHSPLHTQIMRLDADPRFDATWSWITSATVREGFEKAGLHGD